MFLGFLLSIVIIVKYLTNEYIEPIATINNPKGDLFISFYLTMWGGAAGGSEHNAKLFTNTNRKGIVIESFSKRPLIKFCIEWGKSEIKIFQETSDWPGYELLPHQEKVFVDKKNIMIKYIDVDSISDIIKENKINCILNP